MFNIENKRSKDREASEIFKNNRKREQETEIKRKYEQEKYLKHVET